MMYMLHERYSEAEAKKSAEGMKLDNFFEQLDINQSAFVSLNWDTVIERRLAERSKVNSFDYKCGAKAAEFKGARNIVSERSLPKSSKSVPIVKIHGSVNWLYCDNCRQLYWFPPDEAVTVAMQLITPEEGKSLKLENVEACGKWHCLNCTEVRLTTRIATFSFLKALDFPMFEKSWLSAEELLRDSEKWVFVGYSLPAADYEFKHLLKRVQLSRMSPPEFVVITGGSQESCKYTYENYQRFFGRDIKRQKNFFTEGLSPKAIRAAR